MEPRWDIAAVIVAILAIPLAMSPAASHFFFSIFLWVVRTFSPSSGRCERLQWMDIPDGILNDCTIPTEHCEHMKIHRDGESWDGGIGSFFTRIRRGTFVKKPKRLNWKTKYVRTDTQTLKAMSLLLGLGNRWAIRNRIIVFQKEGSILTAFIRIPETTRFQDTCPYINFTKHEVEGFLRGYPPLYRQPLKLPNGDSVDHPIQDLSDIARGGWIVAIAMATTNEATHSHCLHLVEPLEKRTLEETPSTIVEQALRRITHCLENLRQKFPDAEVVRAGMELMVQIQEINYQAGQSLFLRLYRQAKVLEVEFSELPNPFNRWFSDFSCTALRLTTKQCVLIMHVFSQYDELPSVQMEELRPILKEAVKAALVGIYALFR